MPTQDVRREIAALIAARPAQPMRVAHTAAGGEISEFVDGAVWGPDAGHPCRMILMPRRLRGQPLDQHAQLALAARLAALEAARRGGAR